MRNSDHSLAQSIRHSTSVVRNAPAWTTVLCRYRRTRLCGDSSEKIDYSHIPGYRSAKLARLEAVLFTASDPLNIRRLVKAANLKDVKETKALLLQLQEFYEHDETAFQVENVAGGWQLRTRKEFASWLDKTHTHSQEQRLSQPALETLSIVAYRQPVLRTDIEAIRGVACGEMVRQLIERGFVKIVGHHDSLGRPRLYGTTRKFLETFGFGDISELPQSRTMGLHQAAADDEGLRAADIDEDPGESGVVEAEQPVSDEAESASSGDEGRNADTDLVGNGPEDDSAPIAPDAVDHLEANETTDDVHILEMNSKTASASNSDDVSPGSVLARVRRASKFRKNHQEDL